MLNINDYQYDLPPERIAKYPLPGRDASRLLVCKHGKITHGVFRDLAEFLPDHAFLFFNDTKVIPARMHFKKDTGADIEIFLLSPTQPSPLLSETMQATDKCTWQCTIGNLKRWSGGTILTKKLGDTLLKASLLDRQNTIVQLEWSDKKTFAEIMELAGETPLPPYLKRQAERSDRNRYQTIYSHYEGAVAAPTAGLHFTDRVFQSLRQKHVHHDFLTLHVSAGTFQPVKTENATQHKMHSEQVVVTGKNIENLLLLGKFFIPVGTTSMRTLESLYWFGVKLLKDRHAVFSIFQDDPYNNGIALPPAREAIEAVKNHMKEQGLQSITGETAVFIRPGYTSRVCKGLITNFHQPASTLILLIAAFIGDNWKKVYHEALENNYRFLSYGDSSLLIP